MHEIFKYIHLSIRKADIGDVEVFLFVGKFLEGLPIQINGCLEEYGKFFDKKFISY